MITAEAAAAEKKEILSRYRKLLRKAKPFLKDGDAKLIKKAFNVSVEAHKEMRRKSGEPYIYHPIAVAQICVEEIGLGTTSIVAALLHDVVEDTDVTLEEIERDFGPKVARIIDGLTKISGVFEHGASQQAENFRKLLLSLSEDLRVILIKIADRLHNMRTLDSMPRDKQLKIASETIYLYSPLSHRLGLYAIKSEFEDLHLKFTEADTYRQIANKIRSTKSARTRFINKFIEPLQTELDKLEFPFTIKGRPKSIYSIWNKMKRQGVPFEEVYDLFAIRIIIDVPLAMDKAACWQVYSIVTDFYRPNPDRLRDWISNPKSNGYESLHTTVMSDSGQWVEVQIRTKRMDDIAEKGCAAHWKYKEQGKNKSDSGLEDWIARVRATLEEPGTNALEFVEDFQGNLFSEEVFVFTPAGDLKTLAKGASALDFAFDIHTEIGAHCLGAKVNNKLVPLNYRLKNGDQVEILTSKKQKPNEDWLRFVTTGKAKAKIKDLLKEERKQAATDGRELVERKLKQLKVDNLEEAYNKLRAHYDLSTNLELFYRVAKGMIDPSEIKHIKALTTKKGPGKGRISDSKTFKKEISRIKGDDQDALLIGEDMDKIDYTLAKCCNPIQGDDVFGFVTVNEGIKIHRTTCPNAKQLLSTHGSRVVKARWNSQKEIAFLAGLRIIGTDRVGLMNDVTKIISQDLQVNMRSIIIDSEEGIFDGEIKVYVNDTKHLDMLLKRLENVPGVVNVNRFD